MAEGFNTLFVNYNFFVYVIKVWPAYCARLLSSYSYNVMRWNKWSIIEEIDGYLLYFLEFFHTMTEQNL